MTPVGHLLASIGVPRVEDSWLPYPISYFLFTICFEVVAGGITGWFALALTFKIVRVDHPMLVFYAVATIYIVLSVGMFIAAVAMGHSLPEPLGGLAQLVGTVMGLGGGKHLNSKANPVTTTNQSGGLGSSKISDRPEANPARSGSYREALIKDAETCQVGFYKFRHLSKSGALRFRSGSTGEAMTDVICCFARPRYMSAWV
jgi:hypothetical protein